MVEPMSDTHALPSFFVSHGGGPWPYVPEMRRAHQQLEAALRDLPRSIGERPRAVLVITAHWEAPAFSVSAHPKPPMIYDYFGFPQETYRVQYPAPGDPALAERAAGLIEAAGLPSAIDAERGYDHGTFVPMSVMFPEADVPVVQVSIRHGYDPAEHLALGRALAPLRHEGVPIVASGLSWHNLRLMGPAAAAPSAAFDAWLQQTLEESSLPERTQRLLAWGHAPSAHLAHPRADHLIPLLAAVGAAEDEPGRCVHHEDDWFGGVVASSFRFG
jgi:aromatic ring-opening dioxygenase catalytic subunit (LigB family)